MLLNTAFCIESSNSSQLRAHLQRGSLCFSHSPLGFHCCWLSGQSEVSLESEVSPYHIITDIHVNFVVVATQDLHNPFSCTSTDFVLLTTPRGRNYYCPIFTAERTPWLCVCQHHSKSGCLSSAPHRVAHYKLLFPLTLLSPHAAKPTPFLPHPMRVCCLLFSTAAFLFF